MRMCAGRASETTTNGRRWANGSRELAMPQSVAGRMEQKAAYGERRKKERKKRRRDGVYRGGKEEVTILLFFPNFQ